MHAPTFKYIIHSHIETALSQKHYSIEFQAMLDELKQYDLILVDALFSPCSYGYIGHSKKAYAFLHSSTVEPFVGYHKALGR
jgi:hypothetical protein